MDVITHFLSQSNGNVEMKVLLEAIEVLHSLQKKQGKIFRDDINRSLQSSFRCIEELSFHVALIVEGAMQPFLATDGQIYLRLREELVINEILLMNSLQCVLLSRGSKSRGTFSFNHSSRITDHTRQNLANKPLSIESLHLLQRRTFKESSLLKNVSLVENSEPIIRLLARLRKQGMDLLFPQSCHDKVLICVFVALNMLKKPHHRTLIDIIMDIKDFRIIDGLEPVSKTKIRGILALLKHCEVLFTQGSAGQPVELQLFSSITSVFGIRRLHDQFLSNIIEELNLSLPETSLQEVVWLCGNDKKVTEYHAFVDETSLLVQVYIEKNMKKYIGGDDKESAKIMSNSFPPIVKTNELYCAKVAEEFLSSGCSLSLKNPECTSSSLHDSQNKIIMMQQRAQSPFPSSFPSSFSSSKNIWFQNPPLDPQVTSWNSGICNSPRQRIRLSEVVSRNRNVDMTSSMSHYWECSNSASMERMIDIVLRSPQSNEVESFSKEETQEIDSNISTKGYGYVWRRSDPKYGIQLLSPGIVYNPNDVSK